jgi:hypothetical protein
MAPAATAATRLPLPAVAQLLRPRLSRPHAQHKRHDALQQQQQQRPQQQRPQQQRPQQQRGQVQRRCGLGRVPPARRCARAPRPLLQQQRAAQQCWCAHQRQQLRPRPRQRLRRHRHQQQLRTWLPSRP